MCPHFRGVLISEVSPFQRCPHFRGVPISEVSPFQRCPHFRGVLRERGSTKYLLLLALQRFLWYLEDRCFLLLSGGAITVAINFFLVSATLLVVLYNTHVHMGDRDK